MIDLNESISYGRKSKKNYLIPGDGRSGYPWRYKDSPFPVQQILGMPEGNHLSLKELGVDEFGYQTLKLFGLRSDKAAYYPEFFLDFYPLLTWDSHTTPIRPWLAGLDHVEYLRLAREVVWNVKNLLDKPGVYILHSARDHHILYIGSSARSVLERIRFNTIGPLNRANGTFDHGGLCELDWVKPGDERTEQARQLIRQAGFEIAVFVYSEQIEAARKFAKGLEAFLIHSYRDRQGEMPPLNKVLPSIPDMLQVLISL